MGAHLVNSVHLASERIFDQNLELFGLFTDEVISLIEGDSGRVVAAGPGVMERGLVGSQVDFKVFGGQFLPQVDGISLVC